MLKWSARLNGRAFGRDCARSAARFARCARNPCARPARVPSVGLLDCSRLLGLVTLDFFLILFSVIPIADREAISSSAQFFFAYYRRSR